MQIPSQTSENLYFLAGGGEMGALIREKDWSQTPLGSPHTWPQSLRTLVAMMLDNPFGMYIAWGNDYTQLYNDSYRPILGAAKHPQALGISTRETFSEIWHIIGSMFDGVMQGKAVGFPDFMLPLNRNGFIEECYFDFSYSPIRYENGAVGGVLVTVVETTNKKRAEIALKESKDQLEFAMNAAEIATWEFNPETRTFSGNALLKEWHGLQAEENFELEAGFERVLPSDIPHLQQALDHALDFSSGGFMDVEYTIVHPFTNQERVVRAKGKTLFRADKTPYRLSGILQDITQQATSRKKIEESELQLRLALEGGELGTFDFYPETGKLTWSAKTKALFGLPPEAEITLDLYLQAIHPEDTNNSRSMLQQYDLQQKGGLYELEYRTIGITDGKTRWLRSKGKATFDANDKPIRYTGIIQEITARKLAEQALKASEERFRTLADNIPNLAWMAEADGNIFWYNKKWYDYTGTTLEEMIGWGWQTVHHPDKLTEVTERWQESLTSGKPFDMVFPLKAANGTYRQFLTRVLPMYNQEGNIYQWFGTNTDITDQIEAEQNLKESEVRFRNMAENTDILIAISDETSNATYFNKAWEALTGRSVDELRDFGWADLIHPDDRQPFLNTYLTAFQQKMNWNSEFRMLNSQGMYRWLLAKGTTRMLPDGTFSGYISSSLDITDRKEAEQKLKESESRFRNLIYESPVATCLFIGRELRIELANQTMIDYMGKGDSIIGKTLVEALPELEDQSFLKILDEIYTTGETYSLKDTEAMLVVNGISTTSYFDITYNVLRNADGEIFGVMNTAIDVTAKVLAARKVKESEQSLRNTILQAPVAMCLFKGPKHVVTLANDRMIELWGRPATDVMYKPIFEGLPEARDQGLEALIDGVYTTGKTFSAQGVPVNLPRTGGIETAYINFVYEAYRETNQSISGILAVAIDVTQQVIARQKIEDVVAERTKELADANKSLQKSNAELAQFAYIASHDLQEPLRKITTFSQMLEKRSGDTLDETARSYLSKINSSALRMNTLIRDVLTFSELVREEDAFSQVNLNQVVEIIIGDFDLLLEQKGATVSCQPLPVIRAIPLQMAQLFRNLIGNSLKYSRKEVPPVISIALVELTGEDRKDPVLDPALTYIKIQLRDNGIGFKEEYAEKIFNIFQRLHRKSEYEGTGIGLAMCKKIALNHHGNMNATGSSENGAVFNIILPTG